MSDPAGSSWQPGADWAMLALRARLLAAARAWFAAGNLTEVETPALLGYGVTDAQLSNIRVQATGPAAASCRWLHTSPEFHMKRLLAAGAPDIYQICKVFRDGEQGRWHEPEFTMIEWYRLGMDLDGIIADSISLVQTLAASAGRPALPVQELSWPQLVLEATGCDPLQATAAALRSAIRSTLGSDTVSGDLGAALGEETSAWLDLLFSHRIIPALPGDQLSVIRDYPAAQAALARLQPGNPALAERFELFLAGIELANGYHELSDADEQARRFATDAEQRQRLGRPAMAPDPRLLAALAAGLPDCAGVALGFDRLLMALTGAASLSAVISFAGARR